MSVCKNTYIEARGEGSECPPLSLTVSFEAESLLGLQVTVCFADSQKVPVILLPLSPSVLGYRHAGDVLPVPWGSI